MPDDILSEEPSVGLEGEGEAPGDADEVFRFEAGRNSHSHIISNLGMLVIGHLIRAVCGVAIPNIEPEGAVIFEHSPHFPEHLDHFGDVFFGGGFEAELLVDAGGTAFRANISCSVCLCADIRQLLIAFIGKCSVGPSGNVIAPLISAIPGSGAVVTKSPIGWRGNAHLGGGVGDLLEDGQGVAYVDFIQPILHGSFSSSARLFSVNNSVSVKV